MPVTVSHQLSATTPDNPTYEIKPSNWNDTHAVTINAVGSEVSGAFTNAGGVTFGLSANGFISASVQTNYLTTAMESNRGSDFVQANAVFNGTNASGTIASNGISVSVAAPVAQTAFVFSNSNGVSFGTNGSTVTATVATNYQSQGNYLTTAAQSDHSHGNPTLALTNITGTTASASNGLTLSLSGVAAQTTQTQPAGNIAGVGTTFGGANLSASMTFNSNGLNLSMSANAPAAGVGIAAGTRTATTAGNLLFETGNGITFGLNAVGGSVMTASHNGLTTAAQSDHSHGNPTLALTNLTGTTASASNGLTISLSAANPGGGAGATYSFFENVPVIHGTQTFNAVSSTMYVYPFSMEQNMSIGFVRVPFSVSFPATTGGAGSANATVTGQMGFTHGFVIYTQGTGVNADSLQYFTSTSGTGSFGTTLQQGTQSSQMTVTVNGSFGQSGAQTNLGTGTSYGVSSGSRVINSSAMSNFTGPRFVDIPFAVSLSPGNYWVGIGRSWSSANNSTIFNGVNPLSSNIFISQSNITWGIMGSATNTSNVMRQPGAGFFTTNASIISTASINAVGQISVTTSNLVPYFQFIRKA